MRLLDIIFSITLLILLIPIFLLVIAILKFSGEGEVFFLQQRVGKNRESFSIIKFATMLKDSPNIGAGTITENNDPRILPVGKYLRKTKLNELPQIINVLRGEMSFIGPRPHALRDLEGVPENTQSVISSVRPGISGVASIIFRDEEKILHSVKDVRVFYDKEIAPYKGALEVWFVQNRSVVLYFKLCVLTLAAIFGLSPSRSARLIGNVPQPSAVLNTYLNISRMRNSR